MSSPALWTNRFFVVPAKEMADVSISQAAPVQNTYYTVLNTTKNVDLMSVSMKVLTTGETLNARLTLDGITVLSDNQAAVAATIYYLDRGAAQANFIVTTTDNLKTRSSLLQRRSVKVEVRKTTNAGAGDLVGYVKYAKY